MQGGGIKIRTSGPYQGVNLGIQPDLFKQVQVAQRRVKVALKDGAEINFAAEAVVKAYIQNVRPDDGKGLYPAEGGGITFSLQRRNGCWPASLL